MQTLIELIAGFVALLAAAALAQFGVDLGAPAQADREVRRVSDCGETGARSPVLVTRPPSETC